MKWQIFSIGKPSLGYAQRGIDEYAGRIRRYATLEMRQTREAGKQKNSTYLLDASQASFRIALDERGECLSTRQFATKLDDWQNTSVKTVSFLVGGADGHSKAVREQADALWSLSGFTLQHELALVVLLEQIYRVHTILRGEPYHRD